MPRAFCSGRCTTCSPLLAGGTEIQQVNSSGFRMFQIVLNEKHPLTAVGAVQMNGFHEDLPQEFFALFHSVKSLLAAVHRLGGEGKKLYHGSSRGRSTLL